MLKKILTRTIIGGVLSVLSIASYAAPVTWVFDAGGIASGSFTYDEDVGANGTYTNVNITTSGTAPWGTGNCGDVAKCGTYIRATDLNAVSTASSLQVTPTSPTDPGDATGYYGGSFMFASALTNSGGTGVVLIGGTGEGICANATCTAVSNGRGISGSVSSVPLPAAAWLFGSALVGLGALKRRKA